MLVLIHLPSGLLQLAVGWPPRFWYQTPKTYPECCKPTWCSDFPSSPMSPHSSAHNPLASSRSSHPLQDPGTCLQSSNRNYPSLPKGYAQTLHPNPSHLWSLGPPTPKGGQLPLSPVQALLCPGTPIMEPASLLILDSRVPAHLPENI